MTDRLFYKINFYNKQFEAKLDQSQTDGAKLMGAVVAGLARKP